MESPDSLCDHASLVHYLSDLMPDSPQKVLNEVFGYECFRGDQAAIIEAALAGKDALVLMPTGGGKSLCYQIPALLREGTGLVVSPLIALMDNQVAQLRLLGVEAAGDGVETGRIACEGRRVATVRAEDEMLAEVGQPLFTIRLHRGTAPYCHEHHGEWGRVVLRDNHLQAVAEFELLQVFVKRPNRVLSRDQIMDFLGGADRDPFDRSIDVRVTRLRHKIEDDPSDPRLIRTAWGVGYQFTPEGVPQ